MIVLDTDHLTVLQSGKGEAARRLFERLQSGADPVATTIISAEELLRGWLAAIHRERSVAKQITPYLRLKNLFRFFASWDVLEWNAAAVAEFESLKSLRLHIGAMDLKIGAIALSHRATLLTRNSIDFSKIPNLHIEDWL